MIAGISLVKDEIDVIERTVRHMATQVDALLVADNGSTDGTRELLGELAEDLPMTVLDDHEKAHYQARKLTALAGTAAEHGAEWVVPFDADEIHFAFAGRIADVIRSVPSAWIFTADMYEHRPTARDEGEHPFDRMAWRDPDLNPLLKIACRTHRTVAIHEGSHSVDYSGDYPETVSGQLHIRHFPYRSPEQFVSKARNGSAGRNATDLDPEEVSPHLREYGRLLAEGGPPALEYLFYDRFYSEDPEADGLVLDPCPSRS